MSTTVYSFGEWLPDLPENGNPGLTVATNLIPDVGCYRPFLPLAAYSAGDGTLAGIARGLFVAKDVVPAARVYAATEQVLYMQDNAGDFTAKSTSLTSTTVYDWQFAQFENLVFAVNHDNTMFHTVGAATNFATSAAPKAGVIGTVGQFVVVGDLREATDRPNSIRWCAIGDATNWPTPNSATAIATQAGEQDLKSAFGAVQAIVGGDQYATVFQEFGITRMTYVGPPVVFQFDEIDTSRGAHSRHSVIRAGAVTYFKAKDGFYVNNGVASASISAGKIEKTFAATEGFNAQIRGFYSAKNKCVMWSYPEGATTTANALLIYNEPSAKWTKAEQSILTVDQSAIGSVFGPYAFDTNSIYSSFTGTIGSATIATGELELLPGGRAYVDGIKPQIESTATAPAITVRVGYRNDLGTTPSYTATTTPTTRTGFADFRVDAKYHRAEVRITGNFEKATGVVVKSLVTGEA